MVLFYHFFPLVSMVFAKFYIQKHNLENEFFRFDVIEVYLSKDKYKINLIKQIDIK